MHNNGTIRQLNNVFPFFLHLLPFGGFFFIFVGGGGGWQRVKVFGFREMELFCKSENGDGSTGANWAGKKVFLEKFSAGSFGNGEGESGER